MHLPVDGADLVVTFRAHPGPKALVYFGGNSEDVSGNLASFSEAFPDYALYFMSYRGYGGSTGAPTERTNFSDAAALYHEVRKLHSEIAIMGRSLGTGVAVHLASEVPAAQLILITPYSALVDIAAARYWFVPAVRFLLLDKYESDKYAPMIHTPTTILQAEHDQVIPAESTERLHAAFRPGVATLKTIQGTGHNDIQMSPDFFKILQGALQ